MSGKHLLDSANLLKEANIPFFTPLDPEGRSVLYSLLCNRTSFTPEITTLCKLYFESIDEMIKGPDGGEGISKRFSESYTKWNPMSILLYTTPFSEDTKAIFQILERNGLEIKERGQVLQKLTSQNAPLWLGCLLEEWKVDLKLPEHAALTKGKFFGLGRQQLGQSLAKFGAKVLHRLLTFPAWSLTCFFFRILE